jgi:hypothetical protein
VNGGLSLFLINQRVQFSTVIAPAQCRRSLPVVLVKKASKLSVNLSKTAAPLVCLNRASDFAIDQFKLPLRNIVAGLPKTQFYVPGSILRLELDPSLKLAKGMPKESIAWAEDSPVFEVTHEANSSVPAANVHIIGLVST